jgi:uncharacterized protein (DUF1800 family)
VTRGSFAAADAALAAYDGPFGEAEAAHLLRRTSFGGTRDERRAIVELGPARAAIDRTSPPDDESGYARVLDALAPLASADTLEISQSIWLTRMLRDPRPFRELLTLFWHGHFATSVTKVGRTRLLVKQVDMLRELGQGPFGELVTAISRDPAMIVWLDGNANRRHHPNENYARELMELFTLGVGNYTEDDVLEAARAFTGWHEHNGRHRFNAHEHDEGAKTLLGRSGALGGEDVIAACLEQPACGRFVGGKLFRFFVHPHPDDALIEAVGARYRESGYDTLALVRTLVGSRAFYSPEARRSIVKSPVLLAVGAARSLSLRPDTTELADRLSGLGQSLYAPPSVKGWDGGRTWLNAATLIGRANLAAELARRAAGQPVEELFGSAPADHVQALNDALLDGDAPRPLVEALRRDSLDLPTCLRAMLSVPEAQLS